jgi:hypothetical protein
MLSDKEKSFKVEAREDISNTTQRTSHLPQGIHYISKKAYNKGPHRFEEKRAEEFYFFEKVKNVFLKFQINSIFISSKSGI